jgi:hypothetical protein
VPADLDFVGGPGKNRDAVVLTARESQMKASGATVTARRFVVTEVTHAEAIVASVVVIHAVRLACVCLRKDWVRAG